ncbi:hypothetical protein LguiA_007211 [Lonicera macranthoides]
MHIVFLPLNGFTVLSWYLQGTPRWNFAGIFQNIILPGRVIPEWFCNHTLTGHFVSLKLPQNWYYNPKFKGYSFFVILEVINKVKSCNFPVGDDKTHHREDLRWSGLRPYGPIMDVGVELSFREPGHDHSLQKKGIFLGNTDNITCLEHTIFVLMDNDELRRSCINLENALKVDDISGVNYYNLSSQSEAQPLEFLFFSIDYNSNSSSSHSEAAH